MALALPAGSDSICWRCRYWDWCIELTGRKGTASDWVNECHHPGEHEATDNKKYCEGFTEET